MTPIDGFAAWLEQRPSMDGATVVGWRFEIAESQGIRAGVRASRIGGPYEGPGVATRLAGTLELHWSDERVTRTSLDRRAIVDPAFELAGWREDAVVGRGGGLPPLAGPASLPAVETFDAAIDDAVNTGASSLLRTLRRLLDGCTSGGISRVDAIARASTGRRWVATSRQFQAAWDETSSTIELWGDEIAGAEYARRSMPTAPDLDRLVAEVTTLAPLLRQSETLPAAPRGVLFMPAVVDDLLARLLLPNLSGRAIRDGRSPFTLADLRAGRQIVRDDLHLTVDTTLPFELATAPCSAEGIPAGRATLIRHGRLASPILDLATAAELGLPPTPRPRGRPAAILTSERPALELDEALALLGDGIIVRNLPGLHTQQPRRSSYALVAPDVQVVRGGRVGGRCAVRLAGTWLAHLNQTSTHTIRILRDTGMGLLVLEGVALVPA